ncbi:MAG TPA: ABC transporter permease, partial [Dehalococcoidia bacterium]|nr:ABC transporter permease [Dehalococcoidia bacterium]
HIVPGDVVMLIVAEQGNVKEEDLAGIRKELGVDKPLHIQYLNWVGGALKGDFGRSLWTRQPTWDMLRDRIPVTLELALLSYSLALLIAIPIGVLSAVRQDTWSDYLGRIFAMSGLSIPDFWLATVAIIFLSIYMGWSPPLRYVGPFDDLGQNFSQFWLPSLILGYRLASTGMRMTRSTMLEVLRQDYIRTAWSKGLRERAVIYRHALKNAMIPVITIIGRQFTTLLGGTVIIETIFLLPGVGRLTLDAILERDYTQIQTNIMFFGLIMLLSNLVVDISYAWFDPRIRYE